MEYLLIALVFAATWHYCYEAIFLPAIHTALRNKLFALRDALRSLQYGDRNIDQAAFDVAHNGINNAINSVGILDLSMQKKISDRLRDDKAFCERVRKRNLQIENTTTPEIKTIVKKANALLTDIFFFNSGGWFVYVVPIAIGVLCYQQVKAAVRGLFSLGEGDASRILELRAHRC